MLHVNWLKAILWRPWRNMVPALLVLLTDTGEEKGEGDCSQGKGRSESAEAEMTTELCVWRLSGSLTSTLLELKEGYASVKGGSYAHICVCSGHKFSCWHTSGSGTGDVLLSIVSRKHLS